jgi:hypothetical protein
MSKLIVIPAEVMLYRLFLIATFGSSDEWFALLIS